MLHTNLSVVGVAVIRTNGVLASIRFTKALALHRNYTWHARSLLTTRPFQVQRYDIIGLLYTSIIRLESVTCILCLESVLHLDKCPLLLI